MKNDIFSKIWFQTNKYNLAVVSDGTNTPETPPGPEYL